MIRLRALDSSRALIKTLDYINLQWTRKYYGYGQFMVQIAADAYEPDMAYVYSPDRSELGLVQQVRMIQSVTGDYVEIAGYFSEFRLNDKIIYPVYNGSGKTEAVARALFNTYKADIPIELGTNMGLGTAVQIQETGAFLGDRIYELLAPDELSYKIDYDYVNNSAAFQVWQGMDRTYDQSVNPRVVFSRELGNVTALDYISDSSNFKNWAVVGGEGEGTARTYATVDLSGGGYKRQLFVDARDLRSDDLTSAQYIAVLQQRGIEKLLNYKTIEDFTLTIDPTKKGRQYLVDFDLGDKCSININLANASVRYSARVTEIAEVIKDNNWTVDITVGNKMPTDIAVARR